MQREALPLIWVIAFSTTSEDKEEIVIPFWNWHDYFSIKELKQTLGAELIFAQNTPETEILLKEDTCPISSLPLISKGKTSILRIRFEEIVILYVQNKQ